jgi:hypothetical protein
MKAALLTNDGLGFVSKPANPPPEFGTAPEALLQGFADLPDLEIHVISCTRWQMNWPAKLAPNA